MIFVVPDATPVTTPVLLLTVAAAGLLLIHVPPEVPLLLIAIVDPIHTVDEPLNVPAFTVAAIEICCCELTGPLQPATVYVIIALPAAIQLTKPVLAFTVATAVLSLLQVPPVVPSVENGTDDPGQTGNKLPPVIVPAVAVDVTVTGSCAL